MGDLRPMEKKMEATVWGSGLLVWTQKPVGLRTVASGCGDTAKLLVWTRYVHLVFSG